MSGSNQETAQSVLGKLIARLEKLETLRIETTITPMVVDVDPEDPNSVILTPAKGPAEGLLTELHFVTGDMRHYQSPKMLGDEHKAVVESHLQRVAESKEIVHQNIRAIVDLLTGLMKG